MPGYRLALGDPWPRGRFRVLPSTEGHAVSEIANRRCRISCNDNKILFVAEMNPDGATAPGRASLRYPAEEVEPLRLDLLL